MPTGNWHVRYFYVHVHIVIYFYSNFLSNTRPNFKILHFNSLETWKWKIDKSVTEIPEIFGCREMFPWTCGGSETTVPLAERGRNEFLGPVEVSRSFSLRSCPLISSLIYIAACLHAVVSPSVSPSFSPLHS